MGKHNIGIKTKYKKMPAPVKASFWFLVCTILQRGISVITTPIFTRLLSTSEYGAYNVFNSWLGIISVFVTLKLSYGVYCQGLVKYENRKEEFSSAMQGLSLTLTVIFFIIYVLFRSNWNKIFSLSTEQMVAMFGIMWSMSAFEFWATSERVEYRYKKLVVVSLLISVLTPVMGIFAVTHFDDKVTARITSIAIINIIGCGGFFFIQLRRGKTFYSKKIWKYALRFNIPLIPHYLSQTVLNSADRIMIGKMIGDAETGIYSLAYSLALLMTIINSAIMQTMSPWMYRKIRDKKAEEISGISYTALIFVAVMNLFIIALAPEIISFFAPPSYYDAIWVVPPVAMSVIFMFSYDLFAKYEFYYEKTRFIMMASVCGAIVNVILNYIFLNLFGYIAAAYTTLICYMLYTLGHYLFMNRICKEYLDGLKPYDYKVLLTIMIGFMATGFLLMCTYKHPIIRYSILGIAFISILIYRIQIIDIIKRLFVKKKDENNINKE